MTPSQQKALVERAAMEMYRRMAEKLRQDTVMQMHSAYMITLHDKYGFKPDDIKRIFEQVTEQFECIAAKVVTIEDFYRELEAMGVSVA